MTQSLSKKNTRKNVTKPFIKRIGLMLAGLILTTASCQKDYGPIPEQETFFDDTGLNSNSSNRKVLYVLIDGVPTDVIKKLNLPGIQAIAQEGSFLESYQGGIYDEYTETSTWTMPGIANIVNGVWGNKHNIYDNTAADVNYNYPSIFRVCKEWNSDKKIGFFSSWDELRTKVVGESLPQTRNFKFDYVYDGLEHRKDLHEDFEIIDGMVAKEAAETIREKGPDFAWVYLEHPDAYGHNSGTDNGFDEVVKKTDEHIQEIYAAVKEREEKYHEDWLVIVTTDHGRGDKTGHTHGKQSSRERNTWLAINTPVNNYAKNTPQVAAVDIFPTIARFFNINLGTNRQCELDGVPLIGKVSLSNPVLTCDYNNHKFTLTWTPEDTEGTVKVWVSETNNYKYKCHFDEYHLLKEVPVKDGKFEYDYGSKSDLKDFYKFVLIGKYNMVNRWYKGLHVNPMYPSVY